MLRALRNGKWGTAPTPQGKAAPGESSVQFADPHLSRRAPSPLEKMVSISFFPGAIPTSLVAILALLVFFQPSAAQERNWELESELGASLSFGNTRQSDLLARSAFDRADSTYEFAVNGRFIYGEAADEGGLVGGVELMVTTEVQLDVLQVVQCRLLQLPLDEGVVVGVDGDTVNSGPCRRGWLW